ncbi:MAG TPA: glycosyltransferase family 2 protein, partial [Acidobacteriota bacterium]|nr:glycosyltransferase family 2 protein [Acidobacteriota bacterium]
RSWYTPRSSLLALFRQYFQYGYWKVRVIQKHKIPASVRHLIPGLFVLSLLVGPLLGLLWRPLLLLWLFMVVAYVVADLVASALAAFRHGWDLFLSLMVIFPIYHIAYGYGFLRGILDFVLLRRQPSSDSVRLTRTGSEAAAPSRR